MKMICRNVVIALIMALSVPLVFGQSTNLDTKSAPSSKPAAPVQRPGIQRPGNGSDDNNKPKPKPKPKPITPEEKYLSVTQDEFTSLAAGEWFDLALHTNADWTITKQPASWVRLTEMTKLSLRITFNPNPSEESRQTYFDITGAGVTKRIVLKQNGSAPLKLTGLTFRNVDYQGTPLSQYDAPLYSSDMRYLQGCINYDGPELREKKTAYIKIIKPDGTLDHGVGSPAGYTMKCDLEFAPGTGNKAELSYWGNDAASNYSPGRYIYEVWIDGQLVLTSPVLVTIKRGEAGSTINKVWVEQNVVSGGVSGMKIHASVNVQGLRERNIRYCVFFYKADGSTKLLDSKGYHVTYQDTSVADYDSTTWSDWSVFVPYSRLREVSGSGTTIVYNIQIQDDNAHQLLSTSNGHKLTL